LKKFLAAGLVIAFLLPACSGLVADGEESPQLYIPVSTDLESPIITASRDIPEVTETSTPPSADPEATCMDAAGVVETYEIPWKDEVLTGRVYLPPCYDHDPELEYPTLYMLHGATAADSQWDDLGIDEWADTLIAEKEISPLIIIMPKEITWIILPENPFGDHLITAVIPWIDSHYQTVKDREFRAIGGMSRGGNWAVRLGMLHWGLFGSIGAHSTPLFLGDLNRIQGWAEIIPPSQIPRILMDIGEDDNNLADAEAFHQSLLDQDIPHEWRLYSGLHDEHYWKSHLEEYLRWYNEGWIGQ